MLPAALLPRLPVIASWLASERAPLRCAANLCQAPSRPAQVSCGAHGEVRLSVAWSRGHQRLWIWRAHQGRARRLSDRLHEHSSSSGASSLAAAARTAACEHRTHDLRIMRPTRYQLRYCRGYQSLRAGLLQKERRSGAQPTFARCHQGPRRLAVELAGRCACQWQRAVAASDCGSGECTKGTPHV